MKAILEFTLPDDDEALRHALAGADAHYVIADLDRWCRDVVKYSQRTAEGNAVVNEMRDLIRQLCAERDVIFEE